MNPDFPTLSRVHKLFKCVVMIYSTNNIGGIYRKPLQVNASKKAKTNGWDVAQEWSLLSC